MKGLDVAIHLWQEPQAEIKCTICETTGAPLLSLGSVPIWTSTSQLSAIYQVIGDCLRSQQPEPLQAQHERLEAMAADDPRILDAIGTAERDDFPPPVVPNVASLQPTL